MKKKNRKSPNSEKWVKKKPDEVYQYGPLQIARFGKFLHFSNTATDEEHKQIKKRIAEANKEIRKTLESEVLTLQGLVQKYNPIQLMSRAAEKVLPLMAKHNSESDYETEEAFYLPTLEYLQYLIARTEAITEYDVLSQESWNIIWEKAVTTIQLTSQSIWSHTKEEDAEYTELDELRVNVDARRLMIRGDRYQYFYKDYIHFALAPYSSWLERLYSMKSGQIAEELATITGQQKHLSPLINEEAQDALIALMEALAEKGYSVTPELDSPEERERTRIAIYSDEFKNLREKFEEKMKVAQETSVFDITNISSLPHKLLSILSVRPGESVLTNITGPEHDDLSPATNSTLHHKPFLEVNGRFYYFYHTGINDHLVQIIENQLFNQFPTEVSEITRKRGNTVEEAVRKLFTSLLNPDFIHPNVYYPNPDRNGDLTELDILIGVDDILLLVEVKSGNFSEAANRGAPKRLSKDLSKLIVEGQQQSERTERYIKSAEEVPFFEKTGKRIITRIKNSDFRKILRVVVTNENLGWVGAQITLLSVLDQSLNHSVPWHITLDDLRIVHELFLGDEIRFMHFLEQRLEASLNQTITQHDEIEHIGLYNHLNRYQDPIADGLDRISYDASFMQDIDYYFSKKFRGLNPEKPIQEMPHMMKEFMTALSASGLKGRFEVGSAVLSLNGEWREKLEKHLEYLVKGAAEGRQRTIRFPYSDISLGLTITTAKGAYLEDELLYSAAQMEINNLSKWIVVQVERATSLMVLHIETIFRGKFSPIELSQGRAYLESRTQNAISKERPGRNDKCPCGSGKKYKKCHGNN